MGATIYVLTPVVRRHEPLALAAMRLAGDLQHKPGTFWRRQAVVQQRAQPVSLLQPGAVGLALNYSLPDRWPLLWVVQQW